MKQRECPCFRLSKGIARQTTERNNSTLCFLEVNPLSGILPEGYILVYPERVARDPQGFVNLSRHLISPYIRKVLAL